ncbi:FitA-like ribbon-helix-helix domain-containing protein [Dokdonella ginsengisoli]|uniref:Antitoxin FitA-like ribbon-helix-helix domain-containing protein n=1 Tax=Dokdonella ginsengisoli TaxID=363846 RepID=A0ABV9QTD3_9GAMM
MSNLQLMITGSIPLPEGAFGLPSIATRNLDDVLTERLRERVALHDRSMEDEARGILASALAGKSLQIQSCRKRAPPLRGSRPANARVRSAALQAMTVFDS